MTAFPSLLSQAVITALWFIVPVFLATLWWQLRLVHKRQQFMANKMKWDMLEIRIPRGNIKTAKSMEQVFTSIWGIYSFGFPWMIKYLEGAVEKWMSFEIAAKGGGIRFYVRVLSEHRNLLESAIYGQYPDSEIMETEDYTQELPSVVPNEAYELWGSGFTLNTDPPLPIRTYQSFDEHESDDEKRIDPLANVFEAMSKLQNDERIWIQCMVSGAGKPTGVDIKADGNNLIKKIIDDNTKVEGEEGKIMRKPLTHGVQEVIKGIENKISKNIFQVVYRFIYIAPKASFNGQNIPAMMGSFQQFNTQNMNGIRPDSTITIFGGWLARFFPNYKNRRILTKKRMLYDAYVQRRFGLSNRLSDTEKFPLFSTEEVATLYHFPIQTAKAPRLQHIPSRRTEPPVNLPVE